MLRRLLWRIRYAIYVRRHFRVCGNCRYFERVDEWDDYCQYGAWKGLIVKTSSEDVACAKWKRFHDEPGRP